MSQIFVPPNDSDLPSNVPITFQTDSGTAQASNQVITFHGIGGNFSATLSTVTFTVTGSGFIWSDKSTSFLASSNNGYFCTATLTATMPVSPSQGDIIYVISTFTGVVTLQASPGQFFRIGTQVSVSGGICTSNSDGDAIEFTFRASDSTWYCSNSPQGTWQAT